MDDEVTEIIEGQHDITFKEGHVVEKELSYITQPLSNMSLANRLAMPDASTVAESLNARAVATSINANLETEIQLDTHAWTTAQASGTNIVPTHLLPQYYFGQMTDTFVTRLLGNYAYIKWDAMIFKIKLNSTKFHQGWLRTFATPMRVRKAAPDLSFSVHNNNTVALNGGNFFANKSNSIEFRVPWQQVHPYIPLKANDFAASFHTLFMVHHRVIVPLSTSATNEDNVNIAVFCRFENPSVGVRDLYTGLPTFYEIERSVRPQSALEGAISGGLETAMAIESGNVLGAITSGIKTVNSISTLVQNLDKPIYQETSQVALRTTSDIAHGSGISFARKMGLTPSDTHEVPKELQGDMRELDLLYIAQQYGIVAIVNWAQSNPKGTVIATIPLNYMYGYYKQGTLGSQTDPDVWSPVPLTFVTSRYKVAKGGLKFRFTIVASSIHSGRIDASFYPHTDVVLSTIKEATSLKNFVMDFNETNNVFEWTIPYYNSEVWFLTPNQITSVAQYPTGKPTITLINGWGQMTLMVTTELVTTSQVSSSVSVVIEVAGASDIAVAMPNRGFPYESNAPEKFVRAQTRDNYLTEATASKVGLSEVIAAKNIFHGDDIETSVLVLCRRYGCLSLRRWLISGFAQLAWINIPSLGWFWDELDTGVSTRIRAPQTNLAWFSSIYAFWSGPLRYNIVTTLNRTQSVLHYLRYDPVNLDYIFTGSGDVTPNETNPSVLAPFDRFNIPTILANGASQPAIEGEAPFMSSTWLKANFDAEIMPGFDAGDLQFAGWLTYSMLLEANTPQPVSFYVLQSLGDSFMFHGFVGVPLMFFPGGTFQNVN